MTQLSLFPEFDSQFGEQQSKKKTRRQTVNPDYCSAAKAMEMLDLSQHNFDKAIADGYITVTVLDGKRYFLISMLEEFMETDRYLELANGTVDPRNPLND